MGEVECPFSRAFWYGHNVSHPIRVMNYFSVSRTSVKRSTECLSEQSMERGIVLSAKRLAERNSLRYAVWYALTCQLTSQGSISCACDDKHSFTPPFRNCNSKEHSSLFVCQVACGQVKLLRDWLSILTSGKVVANNYGSLLLLLAERRCLSLNANLLDTH